MLFKNNDRIKKSIYFRYHCFAVQLTQKNLSSRQYMSPDAMVFGNWVVNQDSVQKLFELDWERKFVFDILFTLSAHERSNDIFFVNLSPVNNGNCQSFQIKKFHECF